MEKHGTYNQTHAQVFALPSLSCMILGQYSTSLCLLWGQTLRQLEKNKSTIYEGTGPYQILSTVRGRTAV